MSIKLETGKFYRTRDGQKAGPAHAVTDYWHLKVGDKASGYDYRSDGVCALIGLKPEYSVEEPGKTRRDYDIVSEWSFDSAVRTIMRTEIVPGRYNRLIVGSAHIGDLRQVEVSIVNDAIGLTPSELRAAASTLSELAEALEVSK